MQALRKFLDEKVAPNFEHGGKFEKFHPLYEAPDTILFTPGLVTTAGAHIRDALDQKRMMITVIAALQPVIIWAQYNTGFQAQLARERILRAWGQRRAQGAELRQLVEYARRHGDADQRARAGTRLLRFYLECERTHHAEQLYDRVAADVAAGDLTAHEVARGADEAAEDGLRGERLALELGVELHADEPGVVLDLDDLDQVELRVDAGHDQAALL